MAQQPDPLQFTTPFAATKTIHRDPYPAILPSNPSNSQDGKIIIITGANGGIGAAAAKVWAQANATGIVLAARNIITLTQVANEVRSLNSKTTVLAIKTDITSEDHVKNLYEEVKKTFGRPADVLLNNAGIIERGLIGETSSDIWWRQFETNLKGAYNMIHHFIQAQPNPKEPTGTIITVSSGRAALTGPGGSAYNISKLGEQRLNEHLQIECPTLRIFTTMPGIVLTGMVSDSFLPFAKDHADLTGMLSLYLAQPKADFLKGSMVGVNWDVEELEQHKEEIEKGKLFQTSWLPILPINGGKGLGSVGA